MKQIFSNNAPSDLRSQLTILCGFLLVNVALFFLATTSHIDKTVEAIKNDLPLQHYSHPTFANAPDGHRYWGVAKSLSEGLGFYYQTPGYTESYALVRGGPIPPLFFYLPIKFLSETGAAATIVAFQVFLLYLISLIYKRLAREFNLPETITQLLCLFNPLLVVSAHHAQSEILFTFFFSSLVLACLSVISSISFKPINWILLGLFAGCMYLSRPASIFVLTFIPIALLILTSFTTNFRQLDIWPALRGFSLLLPVALLTMSPWLVRNYSISTEQESFIFLPNTITSVHANYSDLLFYGDTVANWLERNSIDGTVLFTKISTELQKLGPDSDNCLSPTSTPIHTNQINSSSFVNMSRTSCIKLVERAIVDSALKQDFLVLVKAGVRAVMVTLLTTGSNSFADYIGAKKSGTGIETLGGNLIYMSIFLVNFVAHFLALVGLIGYLIRRPLDRRNWFLLTMVVSFFISFGFIGSGRFRVPIEPILTLYFSYAVMAWYCRARR